MMLFECQHWGQLLYFENTRCERCGHILGYLADRTILTALTADTDGGWRHWLFPTNHFVSAPTPPETCATGW